MIIGVMADSHDNLFNIEKAVDLFNQKKVNIVLHAGDFIAPFVTRKLNKLKCPLVGVFGNNDGEKKGLKEKILSIGGSIYEPPFSFEKEGKKILLLHDPAKIEEEDFDLFDLIVCGHTHQSEVKKTKKALLVNPGECGGWLTGKSTIGFVDLDTLEVEIKSLD